MSEEKKCNCCGGPTLLFPCSGGSDVGELSDRTAREMTKQGLGNMYCLAGLGGNVESIVNATKQAARIILLDGCPVDCAKKTLERVGISDFEHYRITDIGFKKGQTPVNSESISKIIDITNKK